MTETALEIAQRRMSHIKINGKPLQVVDLRPEPVSRPLVFNPATVAEARGLVQAAAAIEATTGMRPTPWWRKLLS